MTEEQLMRRFLRTAAHLRRKPESVAGEGEKHQCRRGYGYLLDALTPGEGMSQQALADRVEIRAQSASEAVAAMEAEGWVEKRQDEKDRRVTLIFITPAGEEHRDRIRKERRRRAKRFFEPLDEAEKETLGGILEKLEQARRAREEEEG